MKFFSEKKRAGFQPIDVTIRIETEADLIKIKDVYREVERSFDDHRYCGFTRPAGRRPSMALIELVKNICQQAHS